MVRSLLKQNGPIGVMNVVSSHEDCVRKICQNPQLALSFVKILALLSCMRELESCLLLGGGGLLTRRFCLET